KEPALHALWVAAAVQPAQRLDEDLRGEVLGLLAIADLCVDEAVDGRYVLLVELEDVLSSRRHAWRCRSVRVLRRWGQHRPSALLRPSHLAHRCCPLIRSGTNYGAMLQHLCHGVQSHTGLRRAPDPGVAF